MVFITVESVAMNDMNECLFCLCMCICVCHHRQKDNSSIMSVSEIHIMCSGITIYISIDMASVMLSKKHIIIYSVNIPLKYV